MVENFLECDNEITHDRDFALTAIVWTESDSCAN